MNTQSIIGNLTQDVRTGKTEKSDFLSFCVAAETFVAGKKLEFIDCIKFGKAQSLASYLKKGAKVYVSGPCWTEYYKGRTQRKLQVETLELLGRKNED